MTKKKLIERWHAVSDFGLVVQRFRSLFSARGRKVFVGPDKELVNGRSDCRGFATEGKPIADVEFRDLDFTFSCFSNSRTENSIFENCIFVNADFTSFRDHGNRFDRCEFVGSKFNGAAIGFEGTQFSDCRFERCSFTKSIFSRPEFTNVDFVDCRLKSIDFGGSSFENCSFVGKLEDVWFRGGFALPSQIERNGIPRPNRMQNVSFENAHLVDVTFSDNCDLSTVKIASSGEVLLFDKWKQRLERLKTEIVSWEENYQKEADIFANAHIVHAVKQDWYIVSIEDVENGYGKNVATKIIASISADVG